VRTNTTNTYIRSNARLTFLWRRFIGPNDGVPIEFVISSMLLRATMLNGTPGASPITQVNAIPIAKKILALDWKLRHLFYTNTSCLHTTNTSTTYGGNLQDTRTVFFSRCILPTTRVNALTHRDCSPSALGTEASLCAKVARYGCESIAAAAIFNCGFECIAAIVFNLVIHRLPSNLFALPQPCTRHGLVVTITRTMDADGWRW
jgi:hypothetical protein